jgi:hypothetical protein
MKPTLRAVEVHPIQHQGQPMLLLRDPLQLSDTSIAVPRQVAPLLGLMDGTRSETELEASLQVRAGIRLAPGLLSRLLSDLDSAFLLENERFLAAKRQALEAYWQAPFRPLTLDGASFTGAPERAAAHLQAYGAGLPPPDAQLGEGLIRGLVSPHIDYQRGGAVYAQVWRAAAREAREAELVILLGTDHQGSAAALSLTRQSYATPWGLLPTELEVVESLAGALGHEAVFAEELHHRNEHSIELAAVWLHFTRDGHPVPVVPVLCGHFGSFVAGEAEPAGYPPFEEALSLLRGVMAERRTLVVAAADLAHVGPAFGAPYGLDMIGQAQLRNADERLLDTVYAGDASSFFDVLKAEDDRRNVCGLPPIYLTLRLLEPTTGKPAGYALCPADPQGLSFVTIAGVVLY